MQGQAARTSEWSQQKSIFDRGFCWAATLGRTGAVSNGVKCFEFLPKISPDCQIAEKRRSTETIGQTVSGTVIIDVIKIISYHLQKNYHNLKWSDTSLPQTEHLHIETVHIYRYICI